MVDATADEAPARPSKDITAAYRNYALTLLMLIYTVNFLDRQIITTIGESIKNDLHLTDSQMGALGGIFFAAVYTILGIPIARFADKNHRPWVMTVALSMWSGFTVLSAFAKNYAILAFARAGVGIGEAGCSPTAHSLLADYFPKEKRGTALAIYSMGISVGTLLGMAIGGIVAEHWGWRNAYLVAGVPGLIFAVMAILTLREPRSKLTAQARATANAANHIPLTYVFSALHQRPTFWLLSLGGAFASCVSYAHGQFFLPLFLRNHSAELTQLAAQFGMEPALGKPPQAFTSTALGFAAGFGGAFGSWLGGVVADKWGAKDIRNWAMFPFLIPFITIPTLWYIFSTSNMAVAMLLLLIPNVGVGAWWGSTYGGIQSMVPPAMRAVSAAVCLFVINIIGLGAGPTAFGIVTDLMSNRYLADGGLSVEACRTAAAGAKAACAAGQAHGILTTAYLSTAVLPISMLCFLLTRWTIKADMEKAENLPVQPMSAALLSTYFGIGGAITGGFMGNAVAGLTKHLDPATTSMFWLWGLLIGVAVSVALAISIHAKERNAPAPAA